MVPKFTILYPIMLMSLLISGCATTQLYKAPDLPQDEMAIIKAQNKYTNLLRIDGQPTTQFLNFMISGGEFPNNIPVAQGPHTIEVSYWDNHIKGWAAFEIQALREKTYSVRSSKYNNSVSLWVVDQETGEEHGKLLEIHNEPFYRGSKPLTQALLFNFRHPEDNDWIVEQRNTQEISLVRQGYNDDETYALSIMPYPIDGFDSKEDFLNTLKTMRDSKFVESDRFQIVKNELSLIEVPGKICAEGKLLIEDNDPVKRSNHPGGMLLEISSYECQHPENRNIVISFAYSHRSYEENKESRLSEDLSYYFKYLEFK